MRICEDLPGLRHVRHPKVRQGGTEQAQSACQDEASDPWANWQSQSDGQDTRTPGFLQCLCSTCQKPLKQSSLFGPTQAITPKIQNKCLKAFFDSTVKLLPDFPSDRAKRVCVCCLKGSLITLTVLSPTRLLLCGPQLVIRCHILSSQDTSTKQKPARTVDVN